MGIRYSTNGVRDDQLHEEYIFKNFTAAHFRQNIPFHFWQSNIPVSCTQQQSTYRHVEPQEHNLHRHNKNDLRNKNVTEGESS